ncbi:MULTISPECIES: type VI secretion system contractile sheath small subunit [Corallococcus]|uniref:type VI secretion system contractile sheath small subunit n=1 Tax=Corallococcus TaxID=83461 RepID=UPI0011814CA4|nr:MULTISPECIES: type VI secretion system contractile sheath small subunit [Corallococcus]NBD12989.1 type VI secretion system contractile sheath small subunit [Corallococcus silvisoli]TSC25779.1 type VI secretion system contractile sheath small subunit [Corallococcus sp. Z5C101001]
MAITDEIPRSRITLTYRTQVNGTRADKALPFRLLVMGDFSRGTSADRKKDLDQREIRNLDGKNLNQVIQNMGMTLNFSVPNRVDKKDPVDGSAPAPLEVNIKLDSMKSFSPVEVARQVPKINALLTLRKLLLELQGNLDNRKEFRQLVRQLAQNPQAVAKLKTELAAFQSLGLPKKLAATNPTPPTT